MSILYKSPIGCLLIEEREQGFITGLTFVFDGKEKYAEETPTETLRQCAKQLDKYFAGELKCFDLNIKTRGTAFRELVWDRLKNIPYGETVSYKYIAEQIGNPNAVRAVGGANHNNPVSIIIPCHRVIGCDGKLVGYGGEIWRKQWLIRHERNFC